MPQTCLSCEKTDTALNGISTRGVRLTNLRRDVLSALHHLSHPIGAYDLFEQLKKDDKASAPAAVYRVLDFLVEQGLAHKLESLSAYTACSHSHIQHDAVFNICRKCGDVRECVTGSLRKYVDNAGDGFQTEHLTVEALGICAMCQASL